MEFKQYQHVARLGTQETNGIELGDCYIFPKIDGTNASVWWGSEQLNAGSRKRHLTIEKDNAGFFAWARRQQNLIDFLKDHPNHRLFGEWLVPHSLKTYKEGAWRNFYVFDVVVEAGEEDYTYLHYDEYKPLLEKYGIEYIAPIAKIHNGSTDQFHDQLQHNNYLIEDGQGTGEGVVIKNYSFVNKYGRITWAKIVTSEFKDKHRKTMGGHEVQGAKMVEEEIAKAYCTKALCEKTKAKIEVERGEWTKKCIPQLMGVVFHDIVDEEAWNFVKEFKEPTIDFRLLRNFVLQQVRDHLPDVFS